MVLTIINVNNQIVQNVNDIPYEVFHAVSSLSNNEIINQNIGKIATKANDKEVGININNPENEMGNEIINIQKPYAKSNNNAT